MIYFHQICKRRQLLNCQRLTYLYLFLLSTYLTITQERLLTIQQITELLAHLKLIILEYFITHKLCQHRLINYILLE